MYFKHCRRGMPPWTTDKSKLQIESDGVVTHNPHNHRLTHELGVPTVCPHPHCRHLSPRLRCRGGHLRRVSQAFASRSDAIIAIEPNSASSCERGQTNYLSAGLRVSSRDTRFLWALASSAADLSRGNLGVHLVSMFQEFSVCVLRSIAPRRSSMCKSILLGVAKNAGAPAQNP
jgi:hypothetical protein